MPTPGPVLDFVRTLDALDQSRPFAKGVHQTRLLAQTTKAMALPDGVSALYEHAARFDEAGVFAGSDWEHAANLQPSLVRGALTGGGATASLDALSQLRMLAVAVGDAERDDLTAAAARSFLDDTVARNIDLLFPESTEARRESGGPALDRAQRLFEFVADRLGSGGIIRSLVDECERVLLQRPIVVHRVEAMLATAETALALQADGADDAADPDTTLDRARALIAARRGPTDRSRRHPEPAAYEAALRELDHESLAEEARTIGDSMDSTGLVSAAHATLLRFVAVHSSALLPDALALDSIGRASLAEHPVLVGDLIARAVAPETARCIHGLSRLLNRGILFFQPVPPGLHRLLVIDVDDTVADQLHAQAPTSDLDANALLLAATMSVIGQPRGVDQGNNPTCQAARGISLWSQNDVGFLLDLIASAARDGEVVMPFEGDAIRSSELTFGLAGELDPELDAVSLVLTPHLDKIYMEMSRRTIGRGEDGHRWVNPEFHGWWVHRDFASAVEAGTGNIQHFDEFVRLFHATYHPVHNGDRDVVYAQPCGVASTDPNGAFVGWHAVSIQRVAQDPDGGWRVYFFNPNRDKGQAWGPDMQTSTHGRGELEGESSLPFEQFAMRLYVFHYSSAEMGDPATVPADVVERVRAGVAASWGEHRAWV